MGALIFLTFVPIVGIFIGGLYLLYEGYKIAKMSKALQKKEHKKFMLLRGAVSAITGVAVIAVGIIITILLIDFFIFLDNLIQTMLAP